MSIDPNAIETHSTESRWFEPSAEFVAKSRVRSSEEYERLYRESLDSAGDVLEARDQ